MCLYSNSILYGNFSEEFYVYEAPACRSKAPVISKLELVLDIYPNLPLILRYIHCMVFQGLNLFRIRSLLTSVTNLPDAFINYTTYALKVKFFN